MGAKRGDWLVRCGTCEKQMYHSNSIHDGVTKNIVCFDCYDPPLPKLKAKLDRPTKLNHKKVSIEGAERPRVESHLRWRFANVTWSEVAKTWLEI